MWNWFSCYLRTSRLHVVQTEPSSFAVSIVAVDRADGRVTRNPRQRVTREIGAATGRTNRAPSLQSPHRVARL